MTSNKRVKKERSNNLMVLNKKQAISNRTTEPLYIGIEEVMMIYSVSRTTAEKIGKNAGAKIKVGRRSLYNVEKLRLYFESLQSVKA